MISAKFFEPVKQKMMEAGLSEPEVNAEISFAVQLVNGSKKLLEGDRNSILKTLVNLANCKLSLNPVSKQAFLETRYNKAIGKNECSLGVQYTGLVDLLIGQGVITKITTQWVYANDEFKMNIADEDNPVEHSPSWGERGDRLGIYSIAYFKDGTKQVERMTTEEVNAVRERSTGYKYAKEKGYNNTPWMTDYNEMGRKTVLRRFYKYLPKGAGRERIEQAIEIENQDYGANEAQKRFILDLTQKANLALEEVEQIEGSVDALTFDQAHKTIQYLKDNQLSDDPRYSGGSGSKTAMKNAANAAVERDNT